eukprot:6050120-Amphidinium_carterae.2
MFNLRLTWIQVHKPLRRIMSHNGVPLKVSLQSRKVSPHCRTTRLGYQSDIHDETPGWDGPRGMNDPGPTRGRVRKSHDVKPAEVGSRAGAPGHTSVPASINKIQIRWKEGDRRYAKTGQSLRGVVLRMWHDDYVSMLYPSSSADIMDVVRMLEGEVVPEP